MGFKFKISFALAQPDSSFRLIMTTKVSTSNRVVTMKPLGVVSFNRSPGYHSLFSPSCSSLVHLGILKAILQFLWLQPLNQFRPLSINSPGVKSELRVALTLIFPFK